VSSPLHDEIVARIRERGPMTVAQFMELALYHPQHGYYASRPRRSGRHGDFFTSVDVGPLFGELIAVQLVEMWQLLESRSFDLVEAGAGDGRLTRDILDAVSVQSPPLYESLRATLIERSQTARDAQWQILARHSHRIAAIRSDLPSSNTGQHPFTGVVLANELLDALPVHVVAMTDDGLREIYVDQRKDELVEVKGPISDPAISNRLHASGGRLPPGHRRALSLEADRWIARAAAALDRGFLMLFDYGYESASTDSRDQERTLTAYREHTADAVHWLSNPGASDLTAHVDLSAIRSAAEAAGLGLLSCVDQTYFLMALGLADRLTAELDMCSVSARLAAKTLMLPGGLGSTMKVMVFAKGVDTPPLRGWADGRLT
jgi:SAM-dependent MidA family methyltransferase